MVLASRPSASSDSFLDLNLNNTPQVADSATYRALLDIHNALEIIATKLEDINEGVLNNESIIDGYVSAQLSVTTTAIDYVLVEGEGILLTNASTQDVNVTLPSAAIVRVGTEYTIKQVLGRGHYTFVSSAGGTIDRSSNPLKLILDESIIVKSDGTNWFIV